jgi:hypothetical protein
MMFCPDLQDILFRKPLPFLAFEIEPRKVRFITVTPTNDYCQLKICWLIPSELPMLSFSIRIYIPSSLRQD